jgi:hypothetical protein
MKKFAVLDQNNIVNNIVVAGSLESAENTTFSNCVQIPFNVFVDINYAWDGSVFISPKPYPSWILDIENHVWKAPIEKPSDGSYDWDEEKLSWKQSLTKSLKNLQSIQNIENTQSIEGLQG